MDNFSRQILFLLLLILFSAYFSATETAFSSLNKIKIKNDAQSGNKRAKKVLELCEKYDKLLSTILIGNNIVNIMSTSIATALFVIYFPKNGVAISTVVMTVVVLTFGEIIPKSIAKEVPESFAMFSAPYISVLLVILTPVNFFFALLKKLAKKAFKIDGDTSITDRELLTMVEEAKNDGGIDEDEGHLIISAIEFYDLEVSDILTPRVDVIAIDIESSREDIKQVFKDSGYSRLPVYKETIDNIIGIINEKDFFYADDIESILCPAVFVLENMKISNLMQLLRTKKSHLAIVTDEYGGTEGLVTMEDIIEELVGEIFDEHDVVISQDIMPLQNGSFRIKGEANISKVFDYFDIEEEVQEANTVNGWVVMQLDRLPRKGDQFETIVDGKRLSVKVTKADDRRAKEINLMVEELQEEDL